MDRKNPLVRMLVVTVVFLLCLTLVHAKTLFVDSAGSDSTTCGEVSSPCRSIEHASEKRAAQGDIISINDGTFLENQVAIPPGVSMSSTSKDAGKVIIQPKASIGVGTPLITLITSAPGSDGSQSLSYLTIDGRSATQTAMQGIEVRNRDHVAIHHCIIKNFYGIQEWYSNWGLMVWSSQVTPTSDYVYYASLFNDDMTKSANYPTNPVRDFQFYNNRMEKCGDGVTSGDRKLSQSIYPWHLYGSSFHDNYIDVSHRPAQAITACSALLEKVDFYNNVLIGNSVGGYPGSTTSTSLYLIELWVLFDCKFYNNKLINGCISTAIGKNVEWYNNYVDRSLATNPNGIGIEATSIDDANLHHNLIIGNPDKGFNMGMTIGDPNAFKNTVIDVFVWDNIFHGNRDHTIQLSAQGAYRTSKVNAYLYNNLIDLTGETGGYSGIDIVQEGLPTFGDVFVMNNIISNNRGNDIRTKGTIGNLRIENNLFYNNAIQRLSLPPSNIYAEPSFMDYGNKDFRIASSEGRQVGSGTPLEAKYALGLSQETRWGTASSKDVPSVAFTSQVEGKGWEIGPYAYQGQATCTPSWSCADSSCSACAESMMTCTEICTDRGGCLPVRLSTVTRTCQSASPSSQISIFSHVPIAIDGLANEPAWMQATAVTLDKDTTNGRYPPSASVPEKADASLTVRSAWDDKNLYLFAEVKDDIVTVNSPVSELWRDDGIELYLEGIKNSISPYQTQDNKITISSDGRIIDQKSKGWEKTIRVFGKTLAGGYALEIAIPWTTIGASPSDGHQAGIAYQLNDDDGANPDVSLFLKGDGDINSDTNSFKTLALEKFYFADRDLDGDVELQELLLIINQWKANEAGLTDVMEGMRAWRAGGMK